jgi:hypothetical protein
MAKTEKTFKERIADMLAQRKRYLDEDDRPHLPAEQSQQAETLVRSCAIGAGQWFRADVDAVVAWVIQGKDCRPQGRRPDAWLELCAEEADTSNRIGGSHLQGLPLPVPEVQ